jgi:hypothetical protein
MINYEYLINKIFIPCRIVLHGRKGHILPAIGNFFHYWDETNDNSCPNSFLKSPFACPRAADRAFH